MVASKASESKDESAMLVQSDLENSEVITILVSDIIPDPDNPRTYFDPADAQELERSVSTEKQKKHIEVLPPNANGKYMLCDGERRYRALREKGIEHATVIIKRDLTNPLDRHLSATTSNLHQSPMIDHDLALAVLKQKTERGLETNQQVADLMSLDVQKVGKLLRLAQMNQDVAKCTRPDTPDHKWLSTEAALHICKEIEHEDQLPFFQEVSKMAAARRAIKPLSRKGVPRDILREQSSVYRQKKGGQAAAIPIQEVSKDQQQGIRPETQKLILMIDMAIKFSGTINAVFDNVTPRMLVDFSKRLSSFEQEALSNSATQVKAIEDFSDEFLKALSNSKTPGLASSITNEKATAIREALANISQLAEILQEK